MSDMGWSHDPAAGRWELIDHNGSVVTSVTAGQVSTAELLAGWNAKWARKYWPGLDPERPWVHCVLGGGPADGAHQWLDPQRGDVPGEILVAWELALPGMPPGPGPDEELALPPARYVRKGQGSGGTWLFTYAGTGE